MRGRSYIVGTGVAIAKLRCNDQCGDRGNLKFSVVRNCGSEREECGCYIRQNVGETRGVSLM